MTLTQKQEVPHRRARQTSTAARTGQFTGALLVAGGVAGLALRRHNGVWAGLTGLVMASTFRVHPRKVLAVAAHGEPSAAPGERPPGTPRGDDGAWAASRQASSRGSYPAVRRRLES